MKNCLPALLAACVCAAALFSPLSIPAVEAEDGPVYLTDSHGASGVVHAFLELSRADPSYDRYWQGALDWLISVARRDDEGRVAWRISTTASDGQPGHNIDVAAMSHVLNMFYAGYQRSGEERYKETFLDGVRSFVEVFALKRETHLGAAYGWSHAYRPDDRGKGMLAGHSHGLGNQIDVILNACRLDPDNRKREALKGILVNLRLRGRQTHNDSGETLFGWPALKNERIYETGYCYGQAGITIPLYNLAETLPDLALKDGTTPLAMANANLRLLMSLAIEADGGCTWPYMRHEEAVKNIGLGSGAGGIGQAFLRGAQVNRDQDPAFAERCMKYARGAALSVLREAEERQLQPQPLKSPGGAGGFGVCGGVGGAAFLPILYAEEIGDSDPELTDRIGKGAEFIARCVILSASEVKDGTLACADRGNSKRINIALDYGQTGVVLGLATMGNYLENEEILGTAKRVADFVANRAVPEAGGFKFAQFYSLDELREP